MTRILEKGFNFWPEQASSLAVDDIVKMYSAGFAGAWLDPDERDRLDQENPFPAHAYGAWADSGAGKLVVPYMLIEKQWPGCLPGPAQQCGDCVSHSTKNAILLTLAAELALSHPDEVSKVVEGAPEVPSEGQSQGVLSTEAIYWWRRHGGDGWSCAAACNVVKNESGLWVRKPYPDLDIDLTRYSKGLAHKYGARPPSGEIAEAGKLHLVRAITRLDSPEQIRDFLYNGYGISSCGSEGFSNKRDDNGVSSRSGSWAHAMAVLGYDDRPETHRLYGGPLLLIQNSWAKWNSGPRKIMGTNLEIFEGAFWAKWSDCKRREHIATASVVGWPPRKLPQYTSVWSSAV